MGRTSPASTRNNVLLPDPFGPTSPRRPLAQAQIQIVERAVRPRATTTCSSWTGFIRSGQWAVGSGQCGTVLPTAHCPLPRHRINPETVTSKRLKLTPGGAAVEAGLKV